jgi:hypothetical protein
MEQQAKLVLKGLLVKEVWLVKRVLLEQLVQKVIQVLLV